MTGKENFFWIFYGLVLLGLFLLSSTDLIIKEEEAGIYPISVIVGDTTDDQYVNFRKGMERAAIELNGDVSFITLYEKGSARQQREMILREQEDGSQALIVDPVEEGMIAQIRQESRASIPLILINAKPGEDWELENAVSITFDYHGMGRRLGEEVLKEYGAQERVCLLEAESPNGADLLFLQGFCEAMEEEGGLVRTLSCGRESGTEAFLEEVAQGGPEKAVLVAQDPEGLIWAAQLLAETKEAADLVEGLYGRGNTVSALNYLDKGIVQGLCVTDDFSAGYLSVKAAVELAQNRVVKDTGFLESGYIRREDLRDEKYEKMLYPIE